MGIRYQKRIKLSKKTGLNLSKSGASISKRTKYGSFGTRGFSLRTGIPGLSYRKDFRGKNSNQLAFLVLIGAVAVWLIKVIIIYSRNIFLCLYYKYKEKK
jgi:hypothetical protein